MPLEETDIASFAKLWHEEFGETLSPTEARHEASLLLEFYTLLYRADEQSPGNPAAPPLHPSS